MRAPDFWDRTDFLSRLAMDVLSPLGALYGASVRYKAEKATPYRVRVPVICIGNISAGGTGKTPVAIAVADAIIARGRNPFFLTRGYGGKLKGPVVVSKSHRASDVGDEPLLLSRKASTVVARNRAEGAELAAERGADVIIMDDGHQNFSIAKDLSLIVVDGARGFGNGLVLPAGPLREPVSQGLARADAVILSGDGNPALPAFDGLVLRAHIGPAATTSWRGQRVMAFAGIGRPEKFFASLNALGADLVGATRFADHHVYTSKEIAALKAKARAAKALLVTTEKDFARLSEVEREDIAVLPISAAFESIEALDRLLDRICPSL
jgi:tetraacyldisaccharide 4'-kinase